MNLLLDNLPTKIKIKNKIYPIRYDYKTALRVIMAFEDKNLTNSEKVYITLKNIYKDNIPNDAIEEAYNKAIKFLDCGIENKDSKPTKRIYSFSKDGNYIYTGINSTHNIDLEMQNVHWWKFVALFMDMNSECTFAEIIYYRQRAYEGKLTKEEKKTYKKLKDLFDLKEEKEESEEKNNFLKEMGLR